MSDPVNPNGDHSTGPINPSAQSGYGYSSDQASQTPPPQRAVYGESPSYSTPLKRPGVGGVVAKGLVAVLAIFGILAIVVVAAVWFLASRVIGATSGPVFAANSFFTTTSLSGPTASYMSAAPGFRNVMSLDAWNTVSRLWQLSAFASADWPVRKVYPYSADLQGSVHLANGVNMPVDVKLEKEPDGWKVLSLQLNAPASMVTAQAGSEAAVQAQVQQAQQMNPQAAAAAPELAPGVSSVQSVAPLSRPATANLSAQASGRAGPPSVFLASGQVGPTCMEQLFKAGFRNEGVYCTQTYLPTKPGASEVCMAHQNGISHPVTVTFLDYDPVTRQGSIICRLDG